MQAYVYICRNKQRAEYFDDYKVPQSMLFDHSRPAFSERNPPPTSRHLDPIALKATQAVHWA